MYLRVRLGAIMKERGLSEKELHDLTADKTGKKIARNTIRALMRDSAVRVDFGTIERIAAALGVRPMELFEETEKPRGPVSLAPRYA